MSVNLSKLIPIDDFDASGEFFISSYDCVTFGYKMILPEVYTLGKFEAQTFFDGYRGAINKLGYNVVVQKYGLFYESEYIKDYSGNLETREWDESLYNGRPVMNVDHYLFVSFYFGNKNLSSINSPFTKSRFDALDIRKTKSLSVSAINEFKKILSSFEVTMNSVCSEFTKLYDEDILDFIEKYLSCSYSDSGTRDFASYDNRDGIRVGNKDVSVLTMRRMPAEINGFDVANGRIEDGSNLNIKSSFFSDVKLNTSFLFPIAMGLPVEHLVVETLVLLNTGLTESVLNTEMSKLNLFKNLKIAAALEKNENILRFIAATSENDLHYCKYGMSVIIPHKREDKIKITNKIIDIARSSCGSGIELFCENRGDVKAFFNNLPGCGHAQSDLLIGWTESYCTATHIEGFKNGNRDGIRLVDVFGKPFMFDFWDANNKWLRARNAMVLGPTGEGKSFLINNLLVQNHDNGHEIFIIDVGGSYKRSTELVKGEYYDSREMSKFSFNPFKMVYCHPETKKWYPGKDYFGIDDEGMNIQFLSTLIMTIWIGDSKTERPPQTKELIKDSIKLYYDWVNNSEVIIPISFDSYYSYVLNQFKDVLIEKDIDKHSFDVQSFAIMCKKFCSDGDYPNLLNSADHLNLNNSWVCFDLEKINESPDITVIVMLIIMNSLQNRIEYLAKNGRRLDFWIDEAIDFLAGGIFGEYIGGLFRKIRKRNGRVAIATQSIRMLLSGIDPLIESSIFGNCSIKILLDHEVSQKDNYPIIQSKLGLTDNEMKMLRQLTVPQGRPYRMAFMKFGSQPGFIFRNEVSEHTFAAFNTSPEEVKVISEIHKRTGNLKVAIDTYVENKKINSNENN